MAVGDRLVPPDSAVYHELARLHQLAHEARPTDVNRWSGDLYATYDGLWGGFDPKTGDVRLSADLVLRHLTGAPSDTEMERGRQAEALATVLHEATHTGMQTDAPRELNAVRSPHSKGVMEGVAELRTTTDFQAFTVAAGCPGLTLPGPQYPGAHAAVNNLITQASGPALSRQTLIDEMTRGPAVMHFDQLAEGVLQNRLGDVVPNRAEDRQAVRAALIPTMMHPQWPTLSSPSSTGAGHLVAEDIRPYLNSKVDEIRHHYQANPHQLFPADSPNQYAVRLAAESQRESPAQVQQAPAQADKLRLERISSRSRPCGFSVGRRRLGLPLGVGHRLGMGHAGPGRRAALGSTGPLRPASPLRSAGGIEPRSTDVLGPGVGASDRDRRA
jgi:hypothetical protein